MNPIRVQLSDVDRSCTVDAEELQAWSKQLLDDILFEAAKVGSGAANAPIQANMMFSVTVDPSDGSIVIEAADQRSPE